MASPSEWFGRFVTSTELDINDLPAYSPASLQTRVQISVGPLSGSIKFCSLWSQG